MDWLSAATQGAGAIAQVIGQGAQHRHEKSLNERTIQAQRDQAEFAYNKDLEMWNRANEYNAPTAQMARLREAGLNPNLVYGKGATATSSAQLPKYQAVRPEYNYSPSINPAATLEAYNNFRLTNAQVDIAKAQAKKTQAEADNAESYYGDRAALMGAQGKYGDFYYQNRAALEKARVYRESLGFAERTGSTWIDPQGQHHEFANMPVGRRLKIAEQEAAARIRNIGSTIGLRKSQVKDIESKIVNRTWQNQLLKDSSELKQKQVDNYLTEMWGRLGLNAAGQILKMTPMGRLGKAAAGAKGVSGQFKGAGKSYSKYLSNSQYLRTNKKFRSSQRW